jgi:hypothetical protein
MHLSHNWYSLKLQSQSKTIWGIIKIFKPWWGFKNILNHRSMPCYTREFGQVLCTPSFNVLILTCVYNGVHVYIFICLILHCRLCALCLRQVNFQFWEQLTFVGHSKIPILCKTISPNVQRCYSFALSSS